jgi:hypothetical protein
MREESRGAHTRVDFPDEQDEWLKYNVVIKKNKDGTMGLEKSPHSQPGLELKRIANLTIEEMESEIKMERSKL